MIVAVMGVLIMGIAYAQDPAEGPDINWTGWSSNDEAGSSDHGLRWDPEEEVSAYVDYHKDIASTVVTLDPQVEGVVAEFDDVYPFYAPLISVEFTYTGDVNSVVSDVMFSFSHEALSVVAWWIEVDGVIEVGASDLEYVDLPFPVDKVSGDNLLADLVDEAGSYVLVNEDALTLHFITLFGPGIEQWSGYSMGVDVTVEELVP